MWWWLLTGLCLLGAPGDPVDPGACAQCAIDENKCDDNCDKACALGIQICLSVFGSDPNALRNCLNVVDQAFDDCIDVCTATAIACLNKHNCPVLACSD